MKTATIRHALTLALALALLTICAVLSLTPDCVTDEIGPGIGACYWDAHHMGNGHGTSFLWTGTYAIDLP